MEEFSIIINSSENGYNSFEELISANILSSGDTIILQKDVTLESSLILSKKCTIDLNDYHIFIPFTRGIIVKNGAVVTIQNGKIQTISATQIEDAIVVQGSKSSLTLGSELEIDTTGTSVHARRRGNLIIDGATIRANGTQPTLYIDDYASTCTLVSGTVASYAKSAVVVRDGGSVTMNDGVVFTEAKGLAPEDACPAVIVSGQDASFEIIDGTVRSNYSSGVSVQSAGKLVVSGGTIYSNSENYPVIEVKDSYSQFMMSDGWIYSNKTSAILSYDINFGDVQTIGVSGGKVGAVGQVVQVAGIGDHGILFSDGLIKGDLNQAYIAAGYVVSDIKDDEGYAPIILKTWVDASDLPLGSIPDPAPVQPISPIVDSGIEEINLVPIDTRDYSKTNPVVPAPIDVKDLPSDVDPKYIPNLPQDSNNNVPDVDDNIPPIIPDVPAKPDIIHRQINRSINVYNKIYIYRNPSRLVVAAEWIGALTLVERDYYSYDDEEYVLVRFKLPGSGPYSTGYVLFSTIQSYLISTEGAI